MGVNTSGLTAAGNAASSAYTEYNNATQLDQADPNNAAATQKAMLKLQAAQALQNQIFDMMSNMMKSSDNATQTAVGNLK